MTAGAGRLALALCTIALSGCAVAQPGPGPARTADAQRPAATVRVPDSCPDQAGPLCREILVSHNAERARFGYQPLRWNAALADNAQTYARHLAQTGRLVHAPRAGRGIERENLSQGLIGWNADRHVASWVAERQYFRPGIFPNVSTTGNWYDVGHYTQMIWPETTDIGCGMAIGSGFSWMVCRYSPGGNRDGARVG